MSKKKDIKELESEAVVIVRFNEYGALRITSHGRHGSNAAKMADAMVKMSYEILKDQLGTEFKQELREGRRESGVKLKTETDGATSEAHQAT